MIVLNTCISCDRVNTQYLLALATFHVPRGDALVHSLSVSHTSHAHTRYFPAWSCSELTAGHVRLCPGLCQVDPRPLLQARQAQVAAAAGAGAPLPRPLARTAPHVIRQQAPAVGRTLVRGTAAADGACGVA